MRKLLKWPFPACEYDRELCELLHRPVPKLDRRKGLHCLPTGEVRARDGDSVVEWVFDMPRRPGIGHKRSDCRQGLRSLFPRNVLVDQRGVALFVLLGRLLCGGARRCLGVHAVQRGRLPAEFQIHLVPELPCRQVSGGDGRHTPIGVRRLHPRHFGARARVRSVHLVPGRFLPARARCEHMPSVPRGLLPRSG
jgi:hypothetical protein